MKPLLTLLLLSTATATPLFAELSTDDIQHLPPAEIEARLPQAHPASCYAYAARLFGEGRRDDAVRWFYVGQLRFRIHLKASPNLDPGGEPALFASLNATIGREVNEYAGGDVEAWVAEIGKALAWDSQHPNALTPKEAHAAVHAEIRRGLEALAQQISGSAEKIRAERQKRGLENRSGGGSTAAER